MSGNRGATSLRKKRRQGDPMRDFDRLSPELRGWLASAILPWRPKSVQRAYDRALARTRDANLALEELEQMQQRLVAKDVKKVWGDLYPHGEIGRI